jgi:hypothetical protein
MTEHREAGNQGQVVEGAPGENPSPNTAKDPQAAVSPRRPRVFLVLTVVFLGLGILFKFLGMPGRESTALTGAAPQKVGVYVSQQDVMVNLMAGITWDASQPSHASETLFAAVAGEGVTQTTRLLITSTIAPMPGGPPYQETVSYFGGEHTQTAPEWVRVITVAQLESSAGPYGSSVGTFSLPKVVQLSRGSTFAHLPALAPNISPFPSIPIEMTEVSSTGSIHDVVDAPVLRHFGLVGSSSASYVSAFPDAVARQLYYDPQSLMTSESIDGLRTDLENSVINSNLPANGTLQGDNYVWQGTGWLEGYLSATELSASESQADWDFYSGIAWGIAAAVGVAFAQEPSLWRRKKGGEAG